MPVICEGKVAAIEISFKTGKIELYQAGYYDEVDWNQPNPCSLGDAFLYYRFKNEALDKAAITIERGLDDEPILRVTETKRLAVKASSSSLKTGLPNESNKNLKIERDGNLFSFQYVNYLGRTKLVVKEDDSSYEIPLEVIPDKIDYEDDYIKLTEALAEQCAQILLEYSGAVTDPYKASENNSKTLLEQFIFLRQFCYSENILGLFEAIKRNPGRLLIEDEEMKPVGRGAPSKNFLRNPFAHSKNWRYVPTDGGYYMPSQVAMIHKRDILDTPENRFVKFALNKFYQICDMLVIALTSDSAGMQVECRMEAGRLRSLIGDILRDPFFDEIGQLDLIPENSQVLQKREGYSQIFAAYFMVDLALQLDWRGKDSMYEGESKNVALLYEYWLFFELVDVVSGIEGCTKHQSESNPFIGIGQDESFISVSLKEGERSAQSFEIPRLKTKINLYYNRVFPKSFQGTDYQGSYSRPFRPDYTLSIFPSSYSGYLNGEKEAVKDGEVSYLHFDAKHRINDLAQFIGKQSEDDAEIGKEMEEEKADEVTNTYKRGDLLKMHTYNDAIRRTVGSYILYPGDGVGKANGKSDSFSLYDEILPGVGAFAVKPSKKLEAENELRSFITEMIEAKAEQSSRLNRLQYYEDIVLHEPASPVAKTSILGSEEQGSGLCVLGYLRSSGLNNYYSFLKDSGRFSIGSEFLFYYYAIKGDVVYSHHKDISKADRIRFYTNDIDADEAYHLGPIIAEIEDSELVSRASLVKKLTAFGWATKEEDHGADFYYVTKIKVVEADATEIDLKKSEVNAVNGNDSFSPHSPKVVPASFIHEQASAPQNGKI